MAEITSAFNGSYVRRDGEGMGGEGREGGNGKKLSSHVNRDYVHR